MQDLGRGVTLGIVDIIHQVNGLRLINFSLNSVPGKISLSNLIPEVFFVQCKIHKPVRFPLSSRKLRDKSSHLL